MLILFEENYIKIVNFQYMNSVINNSNSNNNIHYKI